MNGDRLPLIGEWMDDPLADLATVVVKREGGLNTKTLHHDKACAINETQSCITVSLKDLPGLSFIVRRHADDRNSGLSQYPLSKLYCLIIAQPHSDQRDGLMHDHVADEQGCCDNLNVLARSRVIPVSLVRESTEC